MSGGSSAPTPYQPTNQAGADQSYQSFINDLGTLQGNQSTVNTNLANQATAVQNNPYYSTAQAGANSVAQQSQGVGQNQISTGQGLTNLGGMAQPLATQIAQSAFDPQQTLYNQGYQQNLDQQNAINSMNGVSGSPYAAGVTGQSAQNFNTNWQNQQLSREATGAGAISQLGSFASGVGTSGSNLQNAGLTTQAQGSALPSNTYLTQENANIAALQALLQGYASQTGNATAGAAASQGYLATGQSATSGAQAAVSQNNAQANAAWSGLLSAGGLAADVFA